MCNFCKQLRCVIGLMLWLTCSVGNAQIGPQEHYDYYAKVGIAPPMLESAELNHLYVGIADLYAGTKNRLEYSVSQFNYILRYIPNHPKALSFMIDSAFALKKPEIAEERIQRAISTYPDTPSTYMIYGMFLQRSGKLPEAKKQYIKSLKMDPLVVATHYNIALLYIDLKDFPNANWHAQKAYELGEKRTALKTRLEQSKAWNTQVDLNKWPEEIGQPIVAAEKTVSESPTEAKDGAVKSIDTANKVEEAKPPIDYTIPDKR